MKILYLLILFLYMLFMLLVVSCQNTVNNMPNIPSNASNASNMSSTFDASAAAAFEKKFHLSCVDSVYSYTGQENPAFPIQKAYGPPLGCGQNCGSTDVFVVGRGETVIFENTNTFLINGEGIDFKLFENAFSFNKGKNYFLDFGFVEISPNGSEWYGFEPVFAGEIEKIQEKERLLGLNTVSVNYKKNPIDPITQEAGGDGFDIAMARQIINRSSENPLEYQYGDLLPSNTKIQYIKIIDLAKVLNLSLLYNGVDIDAICFFYFE